MTWKKLFITLVLLMISTGSVASVFYSPGENALQVWDYSLDMPCTLARLAKLDKLHGWNKVEYDKESDTYTVNCDLKIGANNVTNTYFQIGDKEHPNETLIMRGDLWINPYWVEGENKGKVWYLDPRKVNRLTIGDEKNKSINCVVKFAQGTSLFTGSLLRDGKIIRPSHSKYCWGGQLFVYNSKITALNGKFGHGKNGDLLLHGDGHVLLNAEISGVKGNTCYGMGPGWKKIYKVEDTTFGNYGFLCSGGKTFNNCIFTGANTAFRDSGCFHANFIECTFKGNARNFRARFPVSPKSKNVPDVVCTDCVIEPGRHADIFKLARQPNAEDKLPKLIIKRHIVVEVTDVDGKAVDGATVTFKAEQSGSGQIENIEFKTGADGKTPGKGGKGGLALVETIKALTISGEKVSNYTYTITAAKDGTTASIKGIKPDKSWKIIKIVH